ncbi:peptide methionine sulfoxide reductase [Candidatus Methanomassiliicoccus intestinalis Issoire-Mx1]|uniref:Peptide methionine sulfoxide reductase MsrA n=2 Tax=Candidatus Methanomassiliicoccus intestinalis TaxID=1406512 RepID=R9T3P0_METII|nr:peptide-methionine (S)-S-oxide reductase MsrA [Candidatus Methanomassiliicoccus intestinalis]AGN25492.1 peptide methionine sulfoxide reductase [Candidatus Methanomassiliicoccus intestinalis Issoire-Mx1]
MKEIYLAGGCFWGMQKFFDCVDGVVETEVGYANSTYEKPSYREVCSGRTGSAETVRIEYDGSVLPLQGILELYFKAVDPTVKDRQGNDKGTQYRTGIYYVDSQDKEEIESFIKEQQKHYQNQIVTEVLPLENFYPAEEYHQKYLDKNPHGYCHLGSDAFETAKNYHYDDQIDISNRLSREQYNIMVKGYTELPFSSKYVKNDKEGIYVDTATGEPLFSSYDKFYSKSGWPSFTKPISDTAVSEKTFHPFGTTAVTEVRSGTGDFHLGHVFKDGPEDRGGLRYCINGLALKFIPLEDMEKEGYEYLIPYMEKRRIEKV